MDGSMNINYDDGWDVKGKERENEGEDWLLWAVRGEERRNDGDGEEWSKMNKKTLSRRGMGDGIM